jgi:hypothetical protein
MIRVVASEQLEDTSGHFFSEAILMTSGLGATQTVLTRPPFQVTVTGTARGTVAAG